MKLYTEEQVRKAIEFAQKCEHDCGGVYFEYGIEDVLEDLTPIELPNDEEIDTASLMISKDRKEFLMGAKYIINKIQGVNK